MDKHGVHDHWSDWARRYGSALRATTKTGTAKRLEIDALDRALKRYAVADGSSVLEPGCGNGFNLVALANAYPKLVFHGYDYVAEMVEAADDNLRKADCADRVDVWQGDLRSDAAHPKMRDTYDVVFTDRCLINLASAEEQVAAIARLAALLRPGGLLFLVENSRQTHGRQNDLREHAGLPRREPAAFNCFFDDEVIIPALQRECELLEIEDFGSLHDIALYVLVPATNGGEVDYDHPLVEAATLTSLAEAGRGEHGSYGQNRLYVARRKA